jgi:putative ABC transport system ATP-binding protein
VAAEPAAPVEPTPVADPAEEWPAPAPRVAGAAEAGNALAGAPVQQQEEPVAPVTALVPAAAMAWLSAEQRERIQRAAAAEAEASAAAAAAEAAAAEAKMRPPPLAAAAMAALAGQRASAQPSALAEVPVVAAVPASPAADTASEASAVAPAASEPLAQPAPEPAPTDTASVVAASPDEEDAPQMVASAAPQPEPQPVAAPAQDDPNETAAPVAEGALVAAASAAAPDLATAAAPAAPNDGATKAQSNGWKQPDLGARPVISVRGITKVYTMGDVEVAALRGVDLDVYPGEMTAIMGPSGSGKSTLMNIIGCLDVPTDGVYLLDGEDVSRMKDDELADVRGRKIGFVFQSFNLLPRTSALANVELPLLYTGNVTRGRHKKAQEVLDLVGLGDRVHHKPNELSGGQQQRVAIARALINEPAMILADEPTGNLDTKTSVEIMELFQRLNTERGITVIFVTHNIETADYCHRVVHVRDGHVERDVRHEPRAGIYRDLLPEDLTLDVLQTGAHDAMLGQQEAAQEKPGSEVAA